MRRITPLLLILIVAMSLISCGTNVETSGNSQDISTTETSFPITITDQAGRDITIDEQPESLVSSYYISTSILMALGLEDKIVGIETNPQMRPIYSLAAPQLLDLPNVGSVKEFDIEACAALKPDLIVLPMKLKDAAASLEELGLKVVLISPESTDELLESISIVATATGTVSEGQALVDTIRSMNAALTDLIADSPKPTVYLAGNSALLETASAQMYQSSMIETAGGINVASEVDDTYWTTVSYEQLLQWDPEYIILAADAKYTVDDVVFDTNLAGCTAVKNGNVYAMPNDIEAWDSPVPGGILGSIWLATILHGDKVSNDYYEKSVNDFYGTFYGLTK